jgi:hypothetical protein
MLTHRSVFCGISFFLAVFIIGCGGSASAPAPTSMTYTLTVTSTNPSTGVAIGVSLADNNAATNGSTSFTRTYNAGTSVTLTAPTTSGTNTFSSWSGCTTASMTTCAVTLNANTTLIANYTSPAPVTYTLTVHSTNPASGVVIGASPMDNNSAGGGTTSFNLTYNAGTSVTLTAPTISGANTFSFWSGCSTANYTVPPPPPPPPPSYQGKVVSGSLPVSGAAIQVYAVGSAGNGSAATAMLTQTVITNSTGQFSIAGDYTCGESSTGTTIAGSNQVYIVATGGTDSTTSSAGNSALAMVAAMGPCNNLSSATTIEINELTTAAAAWSLAPFATSMTNIGASATNGLGITNAFLDAALLANPTTGAAAMLPANLTIETGKLSALADALANCVDLNSGSACGPLFTAATSASGTAPADTFTAALNIVKNPSQNVAEVFAAISTTPPYVTSLTKSPNDWTMSLTVTGGGLASPTALGIDGQNNIWVANFSGPLSAFSPQGTPLSSTGFGAGDLSETYGLTVDTSGNIWVSNQELPSHSPGTGSVVKFLGASSGSPGMVVLNSGSPYFYDSTLDFPTALASDSNGDILIANFGNSSATIYSSTGSVVSSGLGNGESTYPIAIAADSSHGVWLASSGDNTITHISSSGAILAHPSCCDGANGIAVDSAGNAWIANLYGGNVTEVSPTGNVAMLVGNGTGGGLSNGYPVSVAIDAAQNVWVADYHGATISELAGNSGTLPAGTAISSSSGYGLDAALLLPFAVVPDASGNLWVSDNGQSNLVMFFGLATPTVTPVGTSPTAP